MKSKGSFALGDDNLISFCCHEWVAWIPMGLFALDEDNKLQYDNIVMHWVLYPFHDDVIVKSTLSSWALSWSSVNET